ncbi:hypothetical protein ACELLULO517_27345 [Acidisoma cellulosilytica]|uniref:Uncharacterized protein n=1 Tax=Acidisoma cellulosilyticum TaxID=2802395 RepID=A0A963Z8F5_9PROT|nr:hypothetical protein [Acidisoma cellulosilyticum]MCB8883985.1 hypothetical protein [Acidisoma cellulosilyticum]
MTDGTPKEKASHATLTITGLENLDAKTLYAIARQLNDGARFWRYGKRAQAELVQFAEVFKAELQRRGPEALAKPGSARRNGTGKQGPQP